MLLINERDHIRVGARDVLKQTTRPCTGKIHNLTCVEAGVGAPTQKKGNCCCCSSGQSEENTYKTVTIQIARNPEENPKHLIKNIQN